MTFGTTYVQQRTAAVKEPPLPPAEAYEEFRISSGMTSRMRFPLTGKDLRTIALMRRGGYEWKAIGARLGISLGSAKRIHLTFPEDLR